MIGKLLFAADPGIGGIGITWKLTRSPLALISFFHPGQMKRVE